MRQGVRLGDRNSFSWPQRLWPQMHKAGEWCLSPCTWYSADGGQRRNDEFRPLLPSLSCGAASPTATVNDSLAAAPRLCPHRCGSLARGNAGWSHGSWPAPCTDTRHGHPSSTPVTAPQLLHTGTEGTPAQGRVCLGVSSASDVHLGRTQPLVFGMALGNPTEPCGQQGMVCCGATSTATAASCGPHVILNGLRSQCLSKDSFTVQLAHSVVSWIAQFGIWLENATWQWPQ